MFLYCCIGCVAFCCGEGDAYDVSVGAWVLGISPSCVNADAIAEANGSVVDESADTAVAGGDEVLE